MFRVSKSRAIMGAVLFWLFALSGFVTGSTFDRSSTYMNTTVPGVIIAAVLSTAFFTGVYWLLYFRPIRWRNGMHTFHYWIALVVLFALFMAAGAYEANTPNANIIATASGAVIGVIIAVVRPTGRQPRRGDYWMAEVPFEDSPERKDRPCLVISGSLRELEVLYITSQNRDHLPQYYRPINTTKWEGAAIQRASWMRIARPDGEFPTIRVKRRHFRRMLGYWDADTINLVKEMEKQQA